MAASAEGDGPRRIDDIVRPRSGAELKLRHGVGSPTNGKASGVEGAYAGASRVAGANCS